MPTLKYIIQINSSHKIKNIFKRRLLRYHRPVGYDRRQRLPTQKSSCFPTCCIIFSANYRFECFRRFSYFSRDVIYYY